MLSLPPRLVTEKTKKKNKKKISHSLIRSLSKLRFEAKTERAMAEVKMCCNASSTELTPEEERITIRDIALASESNSKEGDTFFLITQR